MLIHINANHLLVICNILVYAIDESQFVVYTCISTLACGVLIQVLGRFRSGIHMRIIKILYKTIS